MWYNRIYSSFVWLGSRNIDGGVEPNGLWTGARKCWRSTEMGRVEWIDPNIAPKERSLRSFQGESP